MCPTADQSVRALYSSSWCVIDDIDIEIRQRQTYMAGNPHKTFHGRKLRGCSRLDTVCVLQGLVCWELGPQVTMLGRGETFMREERKGTLPD